MPSQESDNVAQADESPVVAEHVHYVLGDPSVAVEDLSQSNLMLIGRTSVYLCKLLDL